MVQELERLWNSYSAGFVTIDELLYEFSLYKDYLYFEGTLKTWPKIAQFLNSIATK